MNICMAMGEAAAALCADRGVDPIDLDVSIIQRQLAQWGIDLFD